MSVFQKKYQQSSKQSRSQQHSFLKYLGLFLTAAVPVEAVFICTLAATQT